MNKAKFNFVATSFALAFVFALSSCAGSKAPTNEERIQQTSNIEDAADNLTKE